METVILFGCLDPCVHCKDFNNLLAMLDPEPAWISFGQFSILKYLLERSKNIKGGQVLNGTQRTLVLLETNST